MSEPIQVWMIITRYDTGTDVLFYDISKLSDDIRQDLYNKYFNSEAFPDNTDILNILEKSRVENLENTPILIVKTLYFTEE